MIEVGQKIKLIFKNGLVEEGYVEEFENNQVLLKSINSENVLWILNMDRDILGIKIYMESDEEPEDIDTSTITEPNSSNNELSIKHSIYKDIDPDEYKAPTHEDRIKKIAELRQEAQKIEKEKLHKQLTSFKSSGVLPDMITEDNYGLPRQLQRTPNINSTKKDR